MTLHQGNAQFQGTEFTVVEGRHHRWTLLRMNRLHILKTSQKQVLSVSFPPAILLCTAWHQSHHRHHQSPEHPFKRPTMCSSSDQLLSYMKEILTPRRFYQKQLRTWKHRCMTTCTIFLGANNWKLNPGHGAKDISALSSSFQASITMERSVMMGGPRCPTMGAMNGRWCYKRLSPNKDDVAFWVKHSSIKRQETLEQVREGQANISPGFTGNTVLGPPTRGCWWGCDWSQWSSVLGQGSASGYDQLFKSFFWLSCPFSTMNAHRKAPADALNVVTDYSWPANRRAGSAPINPARFTSMLLQGDSNAALIAAWEG